MRHGVRNAECNARDAIININIITITIQNLTIAHITRSNRVQINRRCHIFRITCRKPVVRIHHTTGVNITKQSVEVVHTIRIRFRRIRVFVKITIQRIVVAKVIQRHLNPSYTRLIFILYTVIVPVFPYNIANLNQLHEVVFDLTKRYHTISKVAAIRQDTRSRHIRCLTNTETSQNTTIKKLSTVRNLERQSDRILIQLLAHLQFHRIRVWIKRCSTIVQVRKNDML